MLFTIVPPKENYKANITYERSYKTLKREIKDLNKWKEKLCSQMGRWGDST